MEPQMNAAKSRRSVANTQKRSETERFKDYGLPIIDFDLLGVHPPFSAVIKDLNQWNRR